ncbi:hypothetical protein CENSYa_0946 [Cenarchaeum symbiosum A]|uniref:Uncharacterized protein n=1 Tax=Cenarchaeum symbiosum (strain A) TaxID=414004 RepID=A0RW61_CENSY|nr:hypothetical protein CENSYa_0946 [Cenarchaeum symbiosum A]
MCLSAPVLGWFCVKVRRGFRKWIAAGGGNLLFDHFLFFLFSHITHSIKSPIKGFLRRQTSMFSPAHRRFIIQT